MGNNWKAIAIWVLRALIVLLGGAGGGAAVVKFSEPEAQQVEVQPLEPGEVAPLVLNAPLEVANQKTVWLVTLYWNRLPGGTFGDVYYDSQRVTVVGRPTLENVALAARPPIEGSKLLKVQSAVFLKYVQDDPEGGQPIDNGEKEGGTE